jgi:hypothetical protein
MVCSKLAAASFCWLVARLDSCVVPEFETYTTWLHATHCVCLLHFPPYCWNHPLNLSLLLNLPCSCCSRISRRGARWQESTFSRMHHLDVKPKEPMEEGAILYMPCSLQQRSLSSGSGLLLRLQVKFPVCILSHLCALWYPRRRSVAVMCSSHRTDEVLV